MTAAFVFIRGSLVFFVFQYCAGDQVPHARHELVAGPHLHRRLRISGGIGSPLNPLAIK